LRKKIRRRKFMKRNKRDEYDVKKKQIKKIQQLYETRLQFRLKVDDFLKK